MLKIYVNGFLRTTNSNFSMKKLKNVLVYFPSIENGGMEKNLFNMLNFISNKNLIKFYLLTNFVDKNIKKNFKKNKNYQIWIIN